MSVSTQRQGRITIVTIEREDKRNAVNEAVASGLDRAFNDLEDDPDQWVAVLTGGPRMFCAGTDLRDGPGPPTERGGEYGLIRRRRTKPLIAAVEGIAFGGGFELALASDLVVAATDARFALPEVKRGVIANSGALFRTARALPLNVAKELLLTGDELSAERARELGLVNHLAEPGTALATAVELAERIAANAPVSVRQTLQAVDAVVASDDDAGWRATERAVEVVMAADDLREGISAFLERRPPQWTGR
ncbi:MAG: enoyl-CoA hydratase-related protein [Acidimicrobiia bacterium]|nr:enoyl-CoA hydratase-related protein [Acidimicrobiia bacterium]